MEVLRCLSITVSLLTVTFQLCSICYAKESSSTLQFVNIYARHGDRTPERTYPNDPYKNMSFWYPDSLGALTKRGKQRTFALGQFLRETYDGFLNKYYLPEELKVKSSSKDRCLMTAETILAGLYPPKDKQIWSKTIDWQPIPVHIDHLLSDLRYGLCPKFMEIAAGIHDLPALKRFDEENKAVYAALSQGSGMNITGMLEAVGLYDILKTEHEQGLQLPAWTRDFFPEKLRSFLEYQNQLLVENDNLTRLGAGTILYNLIQNMIQKKEGKLSPDFKVMLYATHDLYLTLILGILGVESSVPIVDYAGAMMFELHKMDTQHEVKLLYVKDAFSGETETIDLPRCGSPCTLEKFQQAFQHVTMSPQDHDRDCHETSADSLSNNEILYFTL